MPRLLGGLQISLNGRPKKIKKRSAARARQQGAWFLCATRCDSGGPARSISTGIHYRQGWISMETADRGSVCTRDSEPPIQQDEDRGGGVTGGCAAFDSSHVDLFPSTPAPPPPSDTLHTDPIGCGSWLWALQYDEARRRRRRTNSNQRDLSAASRE
ncbi:unnamed protein product [Gadus morhua 'NCC']